MLASILGKPDCRGPDPTTEQSAWMVVSAAETLATEHPDPSARLRFGAIARGLLRVLRSSRIEDRKIRTASPIVSGPGGEEWPMIDLLGGFADDPVAGVRAATTILLAADWRAADQEIRRDRPLSSQSRRPSVMAAHRREDSGGPCDRESSLDGLSPSA